MTGIGTDESLWAAVCSGDGLAFGAVFARYGDVVFGQCLRSVPRVEAEDCTATVFFEAWRLRHRARLIDGSLRPWLLTISLNVVRNSRRSIRRHSARLALLPSAGTGPDAADLALARLERDTQVAAIRAALNRLRPAERDVVLLCLVSELSYADAAMTLGVPIGTVRSQLSRARAALRKHLSGLRASEDRFKGDST